MYFKLISKLADNFLQNAYPKFMEILPLLLSTVMLFSSPICDFQGEGYILDKENQSQVFVCSNGENYKEEIVIKVKTKNQEILVKPLVSTGYSPSVFVGSFVDNGLEQLLYQVNSGGSGAYSHYELYSLKDGEKQLLFNSDNFQNEASGKVVGDSVVVNYLGQTFCLDAQNLDLNGKKEVTIGPLNTIFPYYQDAFKKYGLMVLQKIYVDYTANNAGYLITLLSVDDDCAGVENIGILSNFNLQEYLQHQLINLIY